MKTEECDPAALESKKPDGAQAPTGFGGRIQSVGYRARNSEKLPVFRPNAELYGV